MNERFQFLRTYAESINELAKADENLANGLARKIIQYGIYWINEDSWNPIIEAMFIQIKIMIDNWKAISKANTENGKKGWRPSKTWENSQKPKQNQTETETKPNENQTETETEAKKTKIENIKYKKENIITLSKDNVVDKSTKEYWDKEVNKCLELIKQYNNGIIDGTQANQRRFGKHLVNKLKELDSIKEWKFTREETLEIILKVVSQNKYHSWKICSPEQIYRNLSLLMNVCKNDITKTTTGNVILETL